MLKIGRYSGVSQALLYCISGKLPMQMLFRTLFCSVFLAILSFSAYAQEKPAGFPPRDDGASDPTWPRFRDRLLTAIQARDRKFVLGVVDPNVRNGPERPRGLDEFIRQWQPDANDGPLWRELQKALHLGAVYYRNEYMPRSLCAPYVLPRWPQDVDPYGNGAITARTTSVRSAPSGDAKIVADLGYSIVAVADWEVADNAPDVGQKWVKIRVQGHEGYIPEEHIRSPVEYMACFRKHETGWRLTSFLAAGE